MTNVTFVPNITPINADWLNDVNTTVNTLPTSTGTSLIGWLRGATSSVASTLYKWMGWRAVNVFEFMTTAQISDVVSGAAALDATAAIQAAIDASKQVVFGDGSALAKFKVTGRILLKNGSDLDLNGSTILWSGSVMNNANKANKWDNSVFHLNNALDAVPVLSKNVKIRNGSIDANDWGSAITLRYVEGFELSDLIVYRAQCSGIAIVECCNGTVDRFKLVDCAANPTSGFSESPDLENFSDGLFIHYGSQNITVRAGQILNTRAATGRAGIVIEATSAGYPGVPGKTSGNITVQNCYVSGYDRQFHVELADTVSARDCTFEFIPSGAKRNSCSVVSWNTANTTFDNCLLKSTGGMLFHTGSTKTHYRGCDLLMSAGNVANFFRNPDLVTGDITFTECNLDFASGDASAHDVDITFNSCKMTSSVVSSLNFWNGKFRWISCTFNKTALRANLAAAADIYEHSGCTYTGFAGADNMINQPALGLVRLINPNVIGVGTFYLDGNHVIQGMDFTKITISRFNGPIYWNGEYMASAMPTTGTWTRGVRVRNVNPAIGSPKGWTRVTTGSGNVLATDWASEGNL